MIVRRLDSMAVLLCLLAILYAASSHTLNTSALQSMAAPAPEPSLRVHQPPTEETLEQKDPAVLQSTAARAPQPNLSMQQALEEHNLQQQQEFESSPQFPASADTFLKALRAMQDADSLFQASTYNAPSYSGAQWWSIQAADVPRMRSQAALFANGLRVSAGSFGGMFAQLVAQGQKVDAARGLAFLLNANLTISGGCPNPPLKAALAQQLGVGIARAIAMANSTLARNQVQLLPQNVTGAMVADAALAGAMLAAKSCGPPNSLSSRSSEEAQQKYLNSTCYYIGPLLAPAVHSSSVLGQALNTTVVVLEVQDPWASGAILSAAQECAYGPTDLQKAPVWLSSSIGPVDAGERAMTESAQPQDLSDGACEGDCSNSAVSQTSPAAAPAQPISG